MSGDVQAAAVGGPAMRWRRALGWLGGVTASTILIAAAWRANVDLAHQSGPVATADAAVGAAFLIAGAASVGPRRQRLLAGAVGAAWLLASLMPVAGLHRALLLVLLLTFPRGRVSRWGWLPAMVAPLVAAGLLGFVGDAAAFAAVAAVRWPRSSARDHGASRWYPTVAALAVVVVLGAAWGVARTDPTRLDQVLLVYLGVLMAIAVGHVWASRSFDRAARVRLARLVDELGSDDGRDALARVGPLLGDAVGDPTMQVRRIEGPEAVPPEDPGSLVIREQGQPVALARSPALADPVTSATVERLVRLILTADQAVAAEQRTLAELEGAYDRLVAADDRQRWAMAARLHGSVLPLLERATATLDRVDPAATLDRVERRGPAQPDPALLVARSEIASASSELLELVAGVPPSDLAAGDLHAAITALAARSPLPVHVQHRTSTSPVDPGMARVVFALCSEGLANVIKHAEAHRVDIVLSQDDERLDVSVRDDGVGAADVSGSGLAGIADRVTAVGGTMTVSSPAGAGTTVRAVIPVRSRAPEVLGQAGPPAPPPGIGEGADADGEWTQDGPHDSSVGRAAGSGGEPSEETSLGRGVAAVLTAGLLVGTAVVLLSIGVTRTDRGARSSLLDPGLLWPLLLTSLVVAFALGFAWRERRVAVRTSLLLVGAGALLPFWALAPWLPPGLSAAAMAAAPLVIPGAWGVATGWASGRPRGWAGPLILALSGAAVVVHVLGYDPFTDPSCLLTCHHTTPLAGAILTSRVAVGWSCGLALAAAAACAFSVLTAPTRDAAPRGVRVSALVAIALGAAACVARVLHWSTPGATASGTLVLSSALVTCSAVLVAAAQLDERRARLRALVGELTALDLAHAEAAQRTQFRLPDGSGWVDEEGSPVSSQAPPQEAAAVPLGSDIRLLVPSPAFSGLTARLSTADLLALSNLRTRALTQAHQRQVRQTQAQVVARADGERRRIERDLHDGAQQRLVGAKLHLRIARTAVAEPTSGLLDAVEQDLQDAVEALRGISHGLYPRLLESEGIVAALDDLATTAPVPVRLHAPDGPILVPREVALAVYQVADTMVRSVSTSAGSLDLELEPGPAVLLLRASAVRPNPSEMEAGLVEAADRVGAMGGRFDVRWTDDGVVVEGELPCVW